MASGMEGFDTPFNKILLESHVECEGTADAMGRIQLVYSHLCMKIITVLIACAKKVVVGKGDDICWLETLVEARRAINPECLPVCFNTICSMLQTKSRNGI